MVIDVIKDVTIAIDNGYCTNYCTCLVWLEKFRDHIIIYILKARYEKLISFTSVGT